MDQRDETPCGIRGGQGRSAEEVEESTIICAICLGLALAIIGGMWLLHLVGILA